VTALQRMRRAAVVSVNEAAAADRQEQMRRDLE
jgi:hypothetical protein